MPRGAGRRSGDGQDVRYVVWAGSQAALKFNTDNHLTVHQIENLQG